MTAAQRLARAVALNEQLQTLEREIRELQRMIRTARSLALLELVDAKQAAEAEHRRLDAIQPPIAAAAERVH